MHDILKPIVQYAAIVLEFIGVAIIVAGALYSSWVAAARRLRGADKGNIYKLYRHQLGHGILLGLEFLVAADIINSVAVDVSLQSVAVLGLVVLIRTFLSFTLEVEMTGRWPWRGGTEEK